MCKPRGVTYANIQHFGPISVVDAVTRRGVPSRIYINSIFLTTLQSLRAQAGNKANQILNVQFQMVKKLLHELVHALELAVNQDLLAQITSRFNSLMSGGGAKCGGLTLGSRAIL